MTGSDDPTREQLAVEPTVSTAPGPARPHRWWSVLPRHLGRARTSTVVLGLLFLAIGALYLNVRPDPDETTRLRSDTEVTEPATTTGGTTPTAPPTTVQPTPTTTVDPTTSEASTTTTAPTTSDPAEQTTESVPPSPTETVPPVPSTPTTAPPTTAAPTG